MNTSPAIVDSPLRHAGGGQARRSLPRRTIQVASEAHGSACPSRNTTARFRPSTGLGTLSKSKGNEPSRNMPARQPTIWTVGHSTRPISEFIDCLRAHEIRLLVDVRTIPRSRHNPQFNTERLAESLKDAGLSSLHMPALGGLRTARKDSINNGWRNASFRGYADYMQTAEFWCRRIAPLWKRCQSRRSSRSIASGSA